MGLRHHFEQTLPVNLAVTEPHGDRVQFVVVDYNSNDGFGGWVVETFAAELKQGRLCYFRTDEPAQYVHSHAKNLSHRLATHDLVYNLDGDKFLGAGTCELIDRVFARTPRLVVRQGDGGRVCVPRRIFLEELGGYDERFRAWGLEEDDLMARANTAGIPVWKLQMTGTSLPHDQDERFENLSVPAAIPTTEGLTTELVRSAKVLEQKDPR